MGADDFTTYACGKTPQAAFRAAVEHAQYEHGHGGYSGTIAEKHDFVHVDLGGVRPATFFKFFRECETLAWEVTSATSDVTYCRAYGLGVRKKYGNLTLIQAQRKLDSVRKKVSRFEARATRAKVSPELLRRAFAIQDGDKWGPALCLGPITGKAAKDVLNYAVGAVSENKDGAWTYRLRRGDRVYRFSGYASS